MTIDLDQYKRLKEKADKAKSDKARAEGALDEQMKKLMNEFECDSLEDAKKLLEDLQGQEKNAQTLYNNALNDFEEQWKEKV